MAGGPKSFPTNPSSMALNISFLNVLDCFLLGFIAFCKQGFGFRSIYIKPSSVFVAWNRRISASISRGSSFKLTMEGIQLDGKRSIKLWALWGFKPGLDPPDAAVPWPDLVFL